MKKFFTAFLLLFAGLFLVACGNGEGNGDDNGNGDGGEKEVDQALATKYVDLVGERKVYVIGPGLSPDGDTLYNYTAAILDATQAEQIVRDGSSVAELITVDQIEDNSIVFIVPGASGKGLGAAGTNIAGEVARVQAIAAAAGDAERNIKTVVFHIGAGDRRGDTDDIVAAALPNAELMILVDPANNQANADGFFTTAAKNAGLDLYVYSVRINVQNPLKQLFGK